MAIRDVWVGSARLCVVMAVILTALSGASPVQGQLQWEKRSVELRPSLNDTNLVTRFMFKNVGTQTVRVLSVTASCGCIGARADRTECRPGETGAVIVNFTFGDKVGHQEKQVLIKTDDPKEETAVITLKADIPEALDISPGFVEWAVGAKAVTKRITVTSLADFPIRVLKVRSVSEKMKVELSTIREGRKYEIRVTPTDTSGKLASALIIETDLPLGRKRVFTAAASVK